MSGIPQLPPLEPSLYEWKQLSSPIFAWQRKALGGESLWLSRPKEYHEMFLGGTLAIRMSMEKHISAAQDAWRRLRFEFPEIVMTAFCREDGELCMQYMGPKDENEVSEWVNRTAIFCHGFQRMSFEELRDRLMHEKTDIFADQVILLLHAQIENGGSGLVRRVDFMLNVDRKGYFYINCCSFYRN